MFCERLLASLLTCAMASVCFAQITPTRQISAIKVQKLQEPPGSEACASCHSDIYQTYKETAMAKASGPAADGLVTGEFLHKPSGVHYRVYQQDGRLFLIGSGGAGDNPPAIC
jgi:hypothetical protein